MVIPAAWVHGPWHIPDCKGYTNNAGTDMSDVAIRQLSQSYSGYPTDLGIAGSDLVMHSHVHSASIHEQHATRPSPALHPVLWRAGKAVLLQKIHYTHLVGFRDNLAKHAIETATDAVVQQLRLQVRSMLHFRNGVSQLTSYYACLCDSSIH